MIPLLLLFACGDKAQDCSSCDDSGGACLATVSGRVSHGGYLDAGAPITATADGQPDEETTADEFGAYTLHLPPGDWTLHAELECYVGDGSLQVTDCAPQTLDIETEYLCN